MPAVVTASMAASAVSIAAAFYCYDQLKEYTGYTYITDPAKMVGASYDYIVVTLDGIALRNPVGQKPGEDDRGSSARQGHEGHPRDRRSRSEALVHRDLRSCGRAGVEWPTSRPLQPI
jgi:hypothetical protein